ncbi:MAG TPA: amidohydrolase family protein [Verrucomicrobiae bacterium]|jgi:predicted TIM-barrel fold metal-dependent hydrolase|nr:amidohydrolase family protein [Verrucomicrobiae bacterium]
MANENKKRRTFGLNPRLIVCIVSAVLTLKLFVADAPAEPPPEFEQILKIDVHSHIFEEIPELIDMMRRDNVRMINVCNRGRDGHLEEMHRIARDLYKKYPDLFPFTSCFDLTQIEQPNYSSNVITWLDGTFKDGAVMVKLWKEVGMALRRSDGKFVLPDDPVFDPIYDSLAKRGKPLMAHLADPIDAWRPLDPKSVHYGYFSANPEWYFYDKPEYPSHTQIIAARDHILQKHPDLIAIGAHLGSLEHDLDEVAKRLDRYPNFNVDCAARTRDLTFKARDEVRNFFIKYQDRILYGVDTTWKPFLQGPRTEAQRAAFVRRLEERYRTDYRFYSAGGPVQYDGEKVEGLSLPKSILDKFYNGNARRLILLGQKSLD